MAIDFGKFGKSVLDAAGEVAKTASDAARMTAEIAGTAASKTAEVAGDAASAVAETTVMVATAVADTTANVASAAVDAASSAASAVTAKTEEERQKRISEYFEAVKPVLSDLAGSDADRHLRYLGKSPITLTKDEVVKAVESFPIPREQHVLWMDAEFDLRPSGIVVTEAGVFIKTDVNAINFPGNGDKQKKSALYYFRWEDFDPAWFEDEGDRNLALTVDSKCSSAFVEKCKEAAEANAVERQKRAEADEAFERVKAGAQLGAVSAAAAESAQNAVFLEQKAAVNLDAGHGEMAEEANNLLDRMYDMDAHVVGRDNAKDGEDRVIREFGVDKVFIQTKYCKKWRSSLEASFENGGNYRYYDNSGNPMQLEVPKDQYHQVLDGFRIKIKEGKVPGVTDPEQASQIVREGRLTYAQAKNLTKPGTIESLQYDTATGIVTCSCAFGITFVATTFLAWRKGGDLEEAIQAGMVAGVQVFGLSFIQHMLVSQVSRTSIAKSLVTPSELIVKKLGKDATQTIVNGLRTLAGKSPIYGAAATKHLAKIMRSNALTTAITLAVFSIPDTYNLVQRKISGSQYAKNMSVLAAGTAGGIAGGVAAGVAAAKIAGVAGTTVAPGVGTAVGVAGGFVGGTVASLAVGAVGDVLHENDAEITGRLYNAVLSCMIGEYLLEEKEVDALVKKMGEVKDKDLSDLFDRVFQADQQEEEIRELLIPMFDGIVAARPKFALPSDEAIGLALEEAALEGELEQE